MSDKFRNTDKAYEWTEVDTQNEFLRASLGRKVVDVVEGWCECIAVLDDGTALKNYYSPYEAGYSECTPSSPASVAYYVGAPK